MTDPVDLNAAADSRTDAFANPPPRPRIEYEVILLYTGVVLSVVGLAALSGWVFGIMTLVLPVPGFERMAPASAVGMMLFGVALVHSRLYRPWLAVVAIAGGVATIAAGFAQAFSGFSPLAMMLSMPSGLILIGWVFAVGIVLWRMPPRTAVQ